MAARHLQRSQRPSGNLDLLSVNYDSAPDTAFTVQQLCTLFELAGDRDEPAWRTLLARERFVQAAVPGIRTGGFHTPNHRWVMVSALVQAHAAFPDLDVADVVNAYLAEIFDCDAEGFFIERAAWASTMRSTTGRCSSSANTGTARTPGSTAARNLELNLHLLHADGTADTGLSRRQDYGSRTVPTQLIDCYLAAHAVTPTLRFWRPIISGPGRPQPGGQRPGQQSLRP
ncbi:MAG: hypothetical protein R3A10_02450 [Caldilineaceae bacterium]